MSDLVLRIPGKTFFAGEYLALRGGPTLVAATKPYFEVRIRPRKSGENQVFGGSGVCTFHPQSPAGRLFASEAEFFEQFSFEWTKTAYSTGGFGASTAEFIALHALYQMRESLWIEQERHFDLHQMLKSYRLMATNPSSRWVPSGADLVAQVRGGITFFENRTGQVQTFAWPFDGIGFSIVKTGYKIPTHEHLEALGDFEDTGLRAGVAAMGEALRSLNEEAWFSGVKIFAHELEKLGLVAPTTQMLMEQMRQWPIGAMKGCGALGADVLVLFYRNQDAEEIQKNLQALGLVTVATQNDLGQGLSVFVEHSTSARVEELT